MPADFEPRIPSWARFRPPLDRWVVVCVNVAFGPFRRARTPDRTESRGTDRPLTIGWQRAGTLRPMIGRRSAYRSPFARR